ncbi:hypothetical protein [Cronobacter sakazakii]|uniref:hypothetical protein n=1 Tax=Cronobacter sakazakii TaxID=28141 RepID=UPI002895B396|nr:hypothetical protein [Cronobacter sakazakii]MDT3545622.1 hypothetical protein [Cronobacter sakazakii]
MHRIDTPTAQPDKFGPGKNGFTGGNPQTGQLPTALDQDFFDALQEEIARVVEGAGLELDKQNHGQMLVALGMMFASKDSVDGKQPLSDTLTILASLMAGANKLPYFTGNDTAAVTDLTAIGRNIIGKGSIADVLSYLGLGDLPDSFGTAAGKNVGTGADELPTTSQADTRYGLKHWASAGSTLVANQTLIINHGLTIDPDLARLNIKLRCVTANNGYEVGDYAIGFAPRFAAGDTNTMTGNLGAMLTATQAQFNCGQLGLILMPKLNGTPVGISTSAALAQWSFEFHITYQ